MADIDNTRINSDYVICDGTVQTTQGTLGTVISKGSREYPHDPAMFTSPGMDWDNWRATRMNPDAPPRWRDLNGVPYRLCGIGNHYSAVAAFDADPAKESGLATDCRQCLKDAADKIERDNERLEAEIRAEHAEKQRRYRRTVRA